jgi:flavin reductase
MMVPHDAHSTIDSASFRQAMSRLIGSVHVITTTGEEGDVGVTATAVCSVSDDPPTVLVCLNKKGWAQRAIERSGVLAISALSAHHRNLANIFAGQQRLDMSERFSFAQWKRLVTGAPLLEGCVTGLDCYVAEVHEVGTHRVFYCRVIAEEKAVETPALIYGERRYGTINDNFHTSSTHPEAVTAS